MGKRQSKNGLAQDVSEAADKISPSRSAKKRESSALQKLGEELAQMPPTAREELNLPEELSDALKLHDRITDREGARRQRQYIGRLMRGLDAKAIENALAGRRNAQAAQTARFHRAEKLRDQIVATPETALPALLDSIRPKLKDDVDAETCGLLLELAQKASLEKSMGGNAKKNGPKSARQLFRMLAQIIK